MGPQWDKTRNQQQKETQKTHKYVEIKQYILELPIVQIITREIRKYLGTNENKNNYQHLWDAAKAVLRS